MDPTVTMIDTTDVPDGAAQWPCVMRLQNALRSAEEYRGVKPPTAKPQILKL